MITRLLVLLPQLQAILERLPPTQRRIAAIALVLLSAGALLYLAIYRPDEALSAAAVSVLGLGAGLLTSSPPPPVEPPPDSE